MADADDDDGAVTVNALQSRLSELQTLWHTTKRRDSAFHAFVDEGESQENRDAKERPVSLMDTLAFQPTRPTAQPLRSPRPQLHPHHLDHARVPSMETPAMLSTSGPGSRDSIPSLTVPFPPHIPPSPSTSTPRARQKAVLQASLTTTPKERISGESLTLPPLQVHSPTPLTCPQCGARLGSSTAARYCSQCGVQWGSG